MYEELKGKKLLFLGAVRQLCACVETAKKMGVYTVVIDYLPNSPAKAVADEAHLISTTDVDAVVAFCKENHIDGLFTGFTDSMLPYAREICDRMGYPFYASRDQIRMSLDKRFFKECCAKYGVAIPTDYTAVVVRDGVADADVKFPVIVKPVDSSGGRGVRVCRNREELIDAYDFAMTVSPSKNVLVEEYMEGDEFTITYTLKDGEVSLSCFHDKLISQDHPGITSQGDVLMFPSKHLQRYVETCHPAVVALLKGMGGTDGSVFFQGVANEEKIGIFELGYRINGAHDYRHIYAANGINYLEMMIAHALTGKMSGYDLSLDTAFFPRYILTFNIWAHGGVIGAMSGLEEIQKIPNVIFAEYLHDVGDELFERNELAQRTVRAIIADKNVNCIKDTIRRIQSLVRVENTAGENMLYSPFDTDRLNCYPDM